MNMSKKNTKKSKLIMHNDDLTHVDDVVFGLVYVFGYLDIQAQQVALLVHEKGSFCLKEDSSDKLEQYKKELDQFGLKTEIKH